MPADRTYRIRVETVGDPSGAQAASGALNEAAAATGKGAAANAAAGKSFLELTEHSRGFHRLLHQIVDLSPAAGLGLVAAFSGPQAAVMGLIMLVRALKSGEEEAAKAAVEFAKEAGKGWGDIQGIIDGVADAVAKSDQAHANWAQHLGEDSKTISTALDAQIGKLKAEAAAVKEVITAMHTASLARLEADKEAGRVTPEQYEARKTKIAADKRLGEGSVDATASKAELALVQTARDKAVQDAAKATADEKAAFGASENFGKQVKLGELKAKAESDKKAAEALKDKMLEAGAKRGEASLPGGIGTALLNLIGGSLGTNPQWGEEIRQRGWTGKGGITGAEEAESAADKAYRDRSALAQKESDAAARAEAEQSALALKAADAKKRAESAVAQATELKNKADAMATAVGEAEKGRERSEPMKRLGEVRGTPFGQAAVEDVTAAAETARRLAHPEKGVAGPGQDDQQRLVDLATRIAGHQVSLQQAVQIMEPAATNIEDFSKDVLRLVTVMGNLARNMGPIRGRVDALEAEVRALQANPTTRTLPGN